MDILSLCKIGLGTVLGISLGLVLRFILIKLLIIIGVPAAALFAFEYFGVFKIDWLKLNRDWQIYIVPHIVDIYSFFSTHVLVGLVPGIALGFFLAFFLNRKFV